MHNHPNKIEIITIKIIENLKTQEKSNITKIQEINSNKKNHVYAEEVEKSFDKKKQTKINHKVKLQDQTNTTSDKPKFTACETIWGFHI